MTFIGVVHALSKSIVCLAVAYDDIMMGLFYITHAVAPVQFHLNTLFIFTFLLYYHFCDLVYQTAGYEEYHSVVCVKRRKDAISLIWGPK